MAAVLNLITMFEFQTSLIFPTHAVPSAGRLPPGAERLSLQTLDGHTLAGVHFSADEPSQDRPLILGFGGNAGTPGIANSLSGMRPPPVQTSRPRWAS